MDSRTEIATQILAKLAQRDAKPCRRKSDVLEAIAYADELLRRLGGSTDERVHGHIGGAAGREAAIGDGHPIDLRELGA